MPKIYSKSATGTPHRFKSVVKFLREQIDRGKLVPGDRLPSFTELQAKFETTPNTVSRALVELEREGLIHRESRRGLFVAEKKSIRRHVIGLAAFDSVSTISPYYSLLTSGVQSVAHREQFEVALLNLDSLRGLEKVDGVLAHGEVGASFLESLPHDMPRVNVMLPADNSPAVATDDYEGARKATQYLLELGHRRIGFLGFVRSISTARRISGYRAALEGAGIGARAGWVRDLKYRPRSEPHTDDVRNRLRDFGYINAQEWVEDDWSKLGLTAVIVQNDEFAIGLMQALREHGYDVPNDVSVIGFDSTPLCEMCSPRLTSVFLPLEQVGAMATELLLNQIRAGKVDVTTTMLPVSLDIRESTAPAPLPNPENNKRSSVRTSKK